MSSSCSSHVVNELAFQILKTSDKSDSVCLSPLAILQNLNVVLQSTTSTKVVEKIDQLLQFNPDEKKKSQDEKVKIISDLIQHTVEGDKEFVTITLENGIWFPSTMTTENLSTFNNRKICKDDASIKKFNDEIEKITEHKVKSFLNDQNKPKNGITLFNVMHLKACFCNIFRPDSTEIGDFHINGSKTIKVPMLKSGGMVMYNDDKEIGARIMYHSFNGCNFSVLVITPSKRFGLAEMENKLTAEKYVHLTSNMRSVLGSLSIPKIALNKVCDLSSALKKCGLTDLFDSSAANLTKLSKSHPGIDHFAHGISMSFNEFGCHVPKRELRESEMYGMCCGGFTTVPEKQNIVADEPFLLVIHYHKDNSIVSINRVLEPVLSE